MKKLYNQLSALFMVIFLTGISYQVHAQDFSEGFSQDGKVTRKEKKEARDAQLLANFKAIDTLIQNKTFVIEANFLQDRYGSSIPVTSNLNFIKVDPKQVILQTGTSTAYGYNGVGGVTAEGSLSNYKIMTNEKHLNHIVTFTTVTDIGTYDIRVLIAADASVTATITGMTRGNLTYRGNLVAPYNSRVFKGQRTI